MTIRRVVGGVLLAASLAFAAMFAVARSGGDTVAAAPARAALRPQALAEPARGPHVAALDAARPGFPELAKPTPTATQSAALPVTPEPRTAVPTQTPAPYVPPPNVPPNTPQDDQIGHGPH